MKKIAIILPYRVHFSPENAGGLEIGVYYQNKMSDFIDGVTVYGGPIEEPYKDVSYKGLPVGLYKIWGTNRGFARAVRAEWRDDPPDLIEVHNRANVFMDFARFYPEVPLTLYLHNEPQSMKGLKTAAQRQAVLDRASRIICCSSWVKDRYCEGLERGLERVCVVVNGVPRPWDQPPDKDKLILFPNRLIKEKGVELFANALAQVLPDHPEWRCIFVGLGREDVLVTLREILQHVSERVQILGLMPYDEVLDLFAKASIIGVPVTCQEAFGRTAAEALSAGSALVSTSNGGLDDILKRAGVRVEPSVESISAALTQLLEDPAYLNAQQKQAWDGFDFTVQQSADQLHEVRCEIFADA